MKVLFEHNVPHKLRGSLTRHDVTNADEMGWAELKNGDLLTAAENSGFDVLVTADKNLSYQQNLEGHKLAVVVLATNSWKVIKENPTPVAFALDHADPGSFQLVTFEN